jgi:hypothetical protein
MSKFIVKVELQGLKIEVEGSRDDVPRLAQKVGDQIGNLVKPALLLEENRSEAAGSNGDQNAGSERRKVGQRRGSGGGRPASDEINLSIDPAKYGSPRQGWSTAQKAIWFLYVVREAANVTSLTGYAITKSFNKHFKAAGTLNRGNLSRDLEKERLKGTGATVGAETGDGTTKYFLTEAGNTAARRLITSGDAAITASAG